MDIITIEADTQEAIVFGSVVVYAVYIFLLGTFKRFRMEMNELLSEVFDAALTDDERENLGPAIVIPSLISLGVLGFSTIAVNFHIILFPFACVVLAGLWAAMKRRWELKRKELADLGQIDL